MRLRENPIFGRKVFFINPSFVIEKKIVEWLKELEYEVYIIKNYQDAKSILRYFENAMCFINIDDGLSIRGWFNFIKSFDEDPQLKTIFIGILAGKTPEATVNKYIMNLKLPGGYVPLSLPPEEVLKRLTGILELNGAKGNRKYLSLTCSNVEALTGYIAYGSKLYSMTFENISSFGITCYLPAELSNSLKKNTVLSNVSLSLGRWSVITECVVLSINSFNNKIIAVLLFTLNTDPEVKTSIRKFIYDVLNKHLQEIIKNSTPDSCDYSVSNEHEGAIPDYNAPTDDDKADVSEDNGDVGHLEPVAETESTEEKSEASEEATKPEADTATEESEATADTSKAEAESAGAAEEEKKD